VAVVSDASVKNLFGCVPSGPDVIEIELREDEADDALGYPVTVDVVNIHRL
jgi:hypothetical protein